MKSSVEKRALKKSGMKLCYAPDEKIGVIVVDSFPELGHLAALRFIEWVQKNPDGIISLPTGKTPEYFIRETVRLLKTWNSSKTAAELEEWGIDPSVFPQMKRLHFVQIDEFYPINPLQHNSFYYYVQKYYIKGFGLDPQRALFINCNKVGMPAGKTVEDLWPGGEVDLTLRFRHPVNHVERAQKRMLESIDQWCAEYERKIRELGGIGFFLGGIGPDGHIGFNIQGSDFHSTTRLTPTNYETQAAAAQDLGGIEIAKKRLVITIGLATITHNPDCTAIIIAAGEAKAKIVADSIRNTMHIHYPATALQGLKNARFYLTNGAARLLPERRLFKLAGNAELIKKEIERITIDIALKKGSSIRGLGEGDFINDTFGALLFTEPVLSGILQKPPGAKGKPEKIKEIKNALEKVKEETVRALQKKILAGMFARKNTVFLHTEPHHDDIMLGYLPGVVRNIREHSNRHFFVTLTSGFTAVTNNFMLDLLTLLHQVLLDGRFDDLLKENYFDPTNIEGRNRDVWQYLDGVAAHSRSMKNEGRLRRLLRNLIFLFEETDIEQIKDRIDGLINYFQTQYPGRKDLPYIQQLKGMCREWEADCLWGYFGWHFDSVGHLRLGFYKGDIFTEEPTLERDVAPILEILRQVKPDVVSVALDPEASGPDTHYKVLQALTEALKVYEKETGNSDIEIWGYRNVWYRFHPCEADMFIPVSLNMFALQDNAFKYSFISQKDASFPSYEYDGPFSELAQKIQVEQYQILKTCLGREFFNEHESALLRAARGMVFVKTMKLDELYRHSRELKKRTENR